MTEYGTFEWALDHMSRKWTTPPLLTRGLKDEHGNRCWRRVIFRDQRGIYERWSSGHVCPFTPTQEDMLATDWEIA